MSCKITKISLTENIKNKIFNNATSYIDEPNSVYIPLGDNIPTLKVAQEIAERKSAKINSDYGAGKYGLLTSTANTTGGTRIMIHPTDMLIDVLNYKHGLDDDTKLSNNALEEQENKSNVLDNIKDKVFSTKQAVIKYLRDSTNPMFYKIVQVKGGWNAKLRSEYKNVEEHIHKMEDCR